jgi:hypothetical protein
MQHKLPFEFLEPGIPPRDPKGLVEKFKREVRRDGQLCGLMIEAIGMRCDCDDVLLRLLDGTNRVAVVHLTWSGKTDFNTGCPETQLFNTIEEWKTECMISDHKEYTL